MFDLKNVTGKYILDEQGNPIAEPNLMKWAKWFEDDKKGKNKTLIKRDFINGIRISTVFLALDYNIFGKKPILFETMIFGGKYDQYQERYSTRQEAIQGHQKLVKLVKDNLKKDGIRITTQKRTQRKDSGTEGKNDV